MFPPNTPLMLLVLAIANLPGLAAEDSRKSHIEAAMTTALNGVDRADGIDAREAKELASAYFLSAISGCGGIWEIRGMDGVWIADSLIGRGAERGPEVTVSRDGAFVRAEGYPSVMLASGEAVVLEVEPQMP